MSSIVRNVVARNANLWRIPKRRISTRNEFEVEKFGNMKGDWWDQSGQNSPLHTLNELRVSYVRKVAQGSNSAEPGLPLKGLQILDVGCGGGILAEGLARLGANVTGIDANTQLVEIATRRKERYRLDNLEYHDYLVEELQEVETRFDIVISSEVLEHVEEPWAFAAYCSNLVKPGMKMLLYTIASHL